LLMLGGEKGGEEKGIKKIMTVRGSGRRNSVGGGGGGGGGGVMVKNVL